MPKRTFIIAEAGINHNCSSAVAYALCDAAKEASADAIKFQTWITDKIMTPDNPRYEMIKALEMPFDFFRQIKQYCDKIGIMFLSTPDDEESLDFLVDELDMPIIKIGSGNAIHLLFIRKAMTKSRPIIISTGMCDLDDTAAIIRVFCNESHIEQKLTLLHCTSLYPSDYSEVNLLAMQMLIKRYPFDNINFGLSDHTPGIEIPIAAVALGATVIEKHLTLDKILLGPDHTTSLDPSEFKHMIEAIRNVESAMGDGIKRPCERELEVRELYRIKGVI